MLCDAQMINAMLCTQEQFDNGKEGFIDHMTHYFEMISSIVSVKEDGDSQ